MGISFSILCMYLAASTWSPDCVAEKTRPKPKAETSLQILDNLAHQARVMEQYDWTGKGRDKDFTGKSWVGGFNVPANNRSFIKQMEQAVGEVLTRLKLEAGKLYQIEGVEEGYTFGDGSSVTWQGGSEVTTANEVERNLANKDALKDAKEQLIKLARKMRSRGKEYSENKFRFAGDIWKFTTAARKIITKQTQALLIPPSKLLNMTEHRAEAPTKSVIQDVPEQGYMGVKKSDLLRTSPSPSKLHDTPDEYFFPGQSVTKPTPSR